MEPPARSHKAFWLSGFGVFFGLGSLLFGWAFSDNPPRQPIRYNHAVHIASGLTCLDCHSGAQDQVHATLPTLDTCLMCHQEPLTESIEEETIQKFASTGQPIPWRRITRVPADVYFSHRRHVALAGLECAVCHGAMEALTEPPQHPFLPVTMDACLECHEKGKVQNDCNRCHR